MPRRSYVRKGYTPNQNIIAEWINAGRTEVREDPKVRCYAINGQASHLYEAVKAQGPYGTIEDPRNQGTDPYTYTDKNGRSHTVQGKVIIQPENSRFCGMVFTVRHELTGKAVLRNRILYGTGR